MKEYTNSISINGITISGGRSIQVNNGRIIIDGKDVTPETREINLTIQGNIEHLKVDSCHEISINGDVGSISSQSADVSIEGNIKGSVKTMSGDVSCAGSIMGNVDTMSGDICRL